MIAADTSSLVAYFAGDSGADVERLAAALTIGELVLPPVVVTEILSDPTGSPATGKQVERIARLDPTDGYWVRAGHARQLLHKHGCKAKVGDALIAQSCIDYDVALITRDRDFRHFAKHCGLKLA
jgi:predicted nucleic acid-binding protein